MKAWMVTLAGVGEKTCEKFAASRSSWRLAGLRTVWSAVRIVYLGIDNTQ